MIQLIMFTFPVYADTAYLQYDRNENYETGLLSLDCENKVNTTAYFDFSGNCNDGNITGVIDYQYGYFGRCAEFRGVGYDDNITISNESEFDLDVWTIMLWVKFDSVLSTRHIMRKKDGLITNFMLSIVSASGEMNFETRWSYNNGLQLYLRTDDIDVAIDTWYNIAWSFDYTYAKHTDFYVNGTKEINYDISATFNPDQNNAPVVFGATTGLDYNFDGLQDEMRIYPTALTQEEILIRMNEPIKAKLIVEDLEANEDVVQLRFENETIFEQQLADSEGKAIFNIFEFSNCSDEFNGVLNVYHGDIQYEGYVMVLFWGDIYKFTLVGLFGDLFTQLFFGTGAWLGILVLILGSLFCLKLYKYSAVIFSVFFILLGLQYYQAFATGLDDLMWFWVFCWVMPVFLIFAMFKIKR